MFSLYRPIIIASTLYTATAYSNAQQAFQEESFYNGEDFTRPLNRVDIRLEVQKGMNCTHSSDVIATARTDLLIKLPDEWKLGVRADIPYAWYWSNSNSTACYSNINHLDDSLLQIIAIMPPCEKWTLGFGFRAIFPTAGNNLQIGQGKYQLLPSIGFKYDLNAWNPGAYSGLIVRQALNIAGYKSAHYINQTWIEPFFNINLPDQWFLYSSPEIIYNWRTHAWFVPFDLMAGKMLAHNLIVSLEYECAIVYGYKQFTQSLEFRVGYFY